MTKTQIRELKTMLVMIASRLDSTALDDDSRILFYRAQNLLDESTGEQTFRRSVSEAG
jgi:hypothetical protein